MTEAAPPHPADAVIARLEEKLRLLAQLATTLETENRQLRQSLRSAQQADSARDAELIQIKGELSRIRSEAVTILPVPRREFKAELDRLLADLDRALSQLPSHSPESA